MSANPPDEPQQPAAAPRRVRVHKLHVPPPLDKRQVYDRHLADLRASGLNDETIRAAGLYSEERPHALTEICGRTYARTCGTALVFPFHLPQQPIPYAFRIKPTHPRKGKPGRNGKQRLIKYDQSSDAGLLVYLPPWAREAGAYGDVTQPLYFTEGEKKALALDQLRYPTIGLCGVWAYVDTSSEAPANDAPERLHKTIRDHVIIAGRACVICFDADARDNPQVMLAAGRLAGVLLAAGALSVTFITPPSPQQKGIDDFLAAHGAEATRQLLASAQPIDPISPREPAQPIRSIKSMADAPLLCADCNASRQDTCKHLRMPNGYAIENDGVLWRVAADDKKSDTAVARGPVFIQRYLDDYYTHEGRTEIAFQRDGRWVNICVERKTIVDARSMVAALSLYGAPVTSSNAARLVDWVDEYERVNTGKLQRIACVDRTGWHTIDGVRTFVADEPLFADDAETVELAVDKRGDRRRMFDALKPSKDFSAHLAALKAAFQSDPICAAMICGALAATLLEPLGVPNFAVHLPGDSSRGKTTMLKIGSSVFGDPNSEQWVGSWNTTAVAAELRASVLCDLPLCFDEVGAGEKQVIERLIYMLINGGGRSRGQRDLSLRETKSWRTVVLSTGERGLANECAATGAQVRVVQLPVSGIGGLGAEQVDKLREACTLHAGAFGRVWLEQLLSIQDWSAHRADYLHYRETLRARAKNSLQQRTAAYWAVLCTAETMAAGLGLGSVAGKTILGLFDLLAAGEQLRPASERARQHVDEWVYIEPRTFPELLRSTTGDGDDAPRNPHVGVVNGYRRADGAIIFWPTQLRARLESAGFDYEQVAREWLRRGWLETTASDAGRFLKQVKIDGSNNRMLVLLPVASEAAEDLT